MGFSLKKLIKKSVGLDPVTKKVASTTKKIDPLAKAVNAVDKKTTRVAGKLLGSGKRTGGPAPVSTRPAQSAAATRARATGKLRNRKALDY